MLAHILAIAVGLSSLVLFLTAFSMSDIHRRDDFLWSSVGLFYALVLWFCASRITGSLLLGQVAAVALVISFNWQNLKLRKAMQRGLGGLPHERLHQDAIAHPDEAMDTGGFSVTGLISGWFNRSSETNPQPNITDVLEEETNIEKPTTEIQNPVDTATKEETTEAISSFTLEQTDDEPVTEIQNPVNTAKEQETIEAISSFTLNETDEEPVTEIQNPVNTAKEQETIEAISSFSLEQTDDEPVTEIQNPINTSTEEEKTEAISSFTLNETDPDEPGTEIQNPINTSTEEQTVETSSSEEAFFSTTENNNLTESNTTFDLGMDATTEREAIDRTVEEELVEIKEDEPTQGNIYDLTEDATSVQKTTEVEEINSTYTNFNLESQSKETNEEKPIDVKFTTSENQENTQSSIDDFLAELDQNIDKPSQDK